MGIADQTMAQITREQWDDYQNTFVPLENELIAQVQSNDEIEQDATESMRLTNAAFDSAQGVQDRALQSTGTQLDPTQRKALSRRMKLRRAAAVAGAANTTRRAGKDRRLGQMADIVAMGRGVSSNAMQGLSTAASNEAAIKSANANAKAQHQAGQLSGMASGAAMGWQIGGAPGAALGAIAGLIL